MPETPAERVVFTLGLVAIAVLGALVALTWRHDHHSHAARASTVAATTTPPQALSVTLTRRSATTATAPATGAAEIRLLLHARRDTWVSVRAGSADGDVLFTGILAAGSSRSFGGAALWARFGAAANLQASVDGRPLALPGGTYSALITSRGLQKVA